MGWFAVDAEWWPTVADSLPQPWPREAVYADLRWWVDQKGRTPSRRRLAARWGWTDNRVRTLLRDPDAWWDGAKGEPPRLAAKRRNAEHPTSTQRAPNEHPTSTQTGTGKPAESDRKHPLSTQRAPNEHPETTTRVSTTLTLTPPSQEGTADGWTECHDLWRQLHQDAVGRMPPKLTRGKGIGQAMSARIREHSPEAVQAVMRWFWFAPDAEWHRERNVGLRTLMRPQKFDGYLERASAMGPPEPPPKGDQEALKARRARMIEAARQQQRDKTRALRERSQTTGGPRG